VSVETEGQPFQLGGRYELLGGGGEFAQQGCASDEIEFPENIVQK
jgi:hypothetical protein